MNRNLRCLLVVFLSLCTIGQVLAGPVAAQPAYEQQSSPAPDRPFNNAEDNDADESAGTAIGKAAAGAAGRAVRAGDNVHRAVSDGNPTADAETHADETARAVEQNDEALRSLANNWFNTGESNNVIRIEFSDEDGNRATRYVVAKANNGKWESGLTVLTPSEFADTEYEVDHWVTLDPYASRQMKNDINKLARVTENGNGPTKMAAKARLAATYGSGVESDMLDS